MGKLQNIKLVFGDKNTPTSVNQEQIRTLIKVVNDTSLKTKEFSGYVFLASGSINAAEAYALGLAGITYIGATTAVEFSVTADKTTIADNDSVTFDSPEIPVSALVFSIKSAVISVGGITADQLKSKISFKGNVMSIAPFGSVGEVQATVVVRVETRYTPTSVKEITLALKVKTFNAINVNADSYNFDSTSIKTFNLSYTPADATVAIESVAAEFNIHTATYEILSVDKNEIKIRCKRNDILESATVNVAATDKNGNVIRKSFVVTNKVIPNISITGGETFMSPNGNGSKTYLFGYNPIAYNVDVELVSVVSNNSLVKIKEQSLGGFTAYTEGITSNQSATITTTLKVDGVSKTITKTVTANYINMNFSVAQEGGSTFPRTYVVTTTNFTNPSVSARMENTGNYAVSVNDMSITITNSDMSVVEENTLIVTVVDGANGVKVEKSVAISNKIVPSILINGDASFKAKNGNGSADYTFGFNPADYNVAVSLVSVTTDNANVTVSDSSKDGFALNANGLSADANVIISAIFSVDGQNVTTTKNISIKYYAVYNEFKVYQNSAWVVPNSNVDVKVGDVIAQYIGDGLWMVDDALVDDSMNVTAGGVVLGKYGKNEYSDGSELGNEQQSSLSTNLTLPIGTIVTYYYISRGASGTDTIYIKDGGNIIVSKYLGNSYVTEYGTVNKYKITNGNITISYGSNSKNVKFYLKYQLQKFSVLNPDISLPSTSLVAKNGTLDELITPTIPNGGPVVLTGAMSSNSAIIASVIDGKIKLSGTIEEGNPQTISLTINYTVNGYANNIVMEITATYQELKDDNGHEFVDLGLPSGLLWAKYNVGATTEEGEGLYFQWGDTEGHAKDSGYNFSQANYDAKGLNNISADLSLENDAANANMGGTWRMPTRFEVQELRDNCNWEWTTQNGVNGCKVTSNTNGNSIFLAASGYFNGTSVNNFGSQGVFWSRSFNSSSIAHCLDFGRYNIFPQNKNLMYYGYNVRAVL